MQHGFSDFLRHGGDSQCRIERRHGRLVGYAWDCRSNPLSQTIPLYEPISANASTR